MEKMNVKEMENNAIMITNTEICSIIYNTARFIYGRGKNLDSRCAIANIIKKKRRIKDCTGDMLVIKQAYIAQYLSENLPTGILNMLNI